MINKHDELKYLILMKENFRKYKIKTNYFQRWKKLTLINENSIKENNSFENNNKINYSLFKSMNNFSFYPRLNSINIKNRKNSVYRYENDDYINSNDLLKLGKNSINNFNNEISICKNNNFYYLGNINNINNIEIKKKEKKIFSRKKLQISSFGIMLSLNKPNNNNKNLLISKEKDYKNILNIIKNNQIQFINKSNKQNEKMNSIANGQNIIYNNNFENLQNNNMNKNNKKNNIENFEKNNNNQNVINKEDNEPTKNLLIIIILILILVFIINNKL